MGWTQISDCLYTSALTLYYKNTSLWALGSLKILAVLPNSDPEQTLLLWVEVALIIQIE